MMFKPGDKVASAILDTGNLALGTVTEDGKHVIWSEIVDYEGNAATAFGGMKFDRTPRPLEGDEVTCPPAFEELV